MTFMNTTGTFYLIFSALTERIGSPYLTMLTIFLILLLLCLIFRIPLEFTALFLLPLTIIMWAFDASWIALAGVWLIYLGIILAKNLPIGNG